MNTTTAPAHRLRGALAITMALSVLGHAPRAYADPSEADMAQARELLRDGLDLRNKGDAAKALEKLKAAHALARTPITGLELGQTYLALGQLVEARETFLSAAHMPPVAGETSRSTAARTQSDSLAEQLRSRIPSLRVRVTGVPADSVALTIDGAVIPSAALDAPRFLDPGPHVVSARSTAGGAAETRVDLKEGESRDVELKIAFAGGAAPEAAERPKPAFVSSLTPAEERPAAAPAGSRTAGWALIGAGGAVGIAGGVLLGVEAGRAQSAANAQDRSGYDSAKTLWTVGLVGAVAGGVAAATGVVVVLVSKPGGSSTAQDRRVWVSANAGGVLLGGSW